MTVREIVEKYLKENGHDGLVGRANSCGCGLGDLINCCDDLSCLEDFSECVPAKEVICKPEDCEDCYGCFAGYESGEGKVYYVADTECIKG